jgi:prephenate dehydrogenase
MWRDIALTNKQHIAGALLKLEQRLAHIRQNLDTRQLQQEFEQAHRLKQHSAHRHGVVQKTKGKTREA